MNDNELMNRRRFFKKTAKEMLPMLGAFVAGPTVILNTLASCGSDGCDGCEAACQDNCSSSCYGSCSSSSSNEGCSDCSSSCKGTCSTTCLDSCRGSSQSTPSSKGDGSYSNPFNASEARNYAASLAADETTTKSFYVKGRVSSIKNNFSIEYGTAIFYMTDEGKSEDIFQVYRAYYLENKAYQSGDLLAVGDNVVVYGKLSNYKGTTPELADRKGYLYSLNGKTTPAVTTGGDGSLSNPYNAKEASDYAKSLGADVVSSNNVYVKGVISSIKYEYSANYGTAVYNISDTGRAENEFTIYSSYFFDNKPWKEGNTQIKVGDTVIVCGRVVFYKGTNPEMAEKKSWLYSLNGKTSDSGNSGCSGSCASTCSSTCTGTCEGQCAVGCSSSCGADCAGSCSSGCSTTCTGTCKGECSTTCAGGCSSGCSTTCTGGCDTGCNTGCTSSCAKGCSNDCTGSCDTGCDTGCSTSCARGCAETCATDCKWECTRNCASDCTRNCASDCSSTCTSNCANDCTRACANNCLTGCEDTCRTGCYGSCNGSCGGECRGKCINSCGQYCKGGNSGSCRSSCNYDCSNSCSNTCYTMCYSSSM